MATGLDVHRSSGRTSQLEAQCHLEWIDGMCTRDEAPLPCGYQGGVVQEGVPFDYCGLSHGSGHALDLKANPDVAEYTRGKSDRREEWRNVADELPGRPIDEFYRQGATLLRRACVSTASTCTIMELLKVT